MKKYISVLCIILFAVLLPACSAQDKAHNSSKIITFQMNPSENGVEDFLNRLGSHPTGYEDDTCYSITPETITESYGFELFKFDASCSSFLLYDDQIYPLGSWFGGYGVTSFAIADLNGDSHTELYFTFSSGSGMHRSMAGYFNTADKKISIFDFENMGRDSVLTADSDDMLGVYNAVCDPTSFVDIKMTPDSKLGSITFNAGNIVLTETEASQQE